MISMSAWGCGGQGPLAAKRSSSLRVTEVANVVCQQRFVVPLPATSCTVTGGVNAGSGGSSQPAGRGPAAGRRNPGRAGTTTGVGGTNAGTGPYHCLDPWPAYSLGMTGYDESDKLVFKKRPDGFQKNEWRLFYHFFKIKKQIVTPWSCNHLLFVRKETKKWIQIHFFAQLPTRGGTFFKI